jgi:hypothetical protein
MIGKIEVCDLSPRKPNFSSDDLAELEGRGIDAVDARRADHSGDRLCLRLCQPNVLPMETSKPGDRCDTPDCLHWSMERSILVQRKVRARSVIIGAIICQQVAKVIFAEHHDARAIRRIGRSSTDYGSSEM